MLKTPKETPNWFKIAKDDSRITSKEVCEVLNISRRSLGTYLQKGIVPRPYSELGTGRRHNAAYWQVKQIRAILDSLKGE